MFLLKTKSVNGIIKSAGYPHLKKQAIIEGKGSSRLGVLVGLPPVSLVDILQATGGRFGS